MNKVLQPEGWATPRGYSNGIEARGRQIYVGGQVGWDAECRFPSEDLVQQVFLALKNAVEVLRVAGGGPEHVTRMTWYLLDRKEYVARLKEIGQVYRDVMGRNFPAMSAVQVAGLVEDDAKVEIEVTAVIPD